MTPIPYLFFQGNCRAAMMRYAEVFGAPPPELMTVGDAPPDENMPAEMADQIMHGALKIGDGWIYASDDIGDDTPAMAGCNVMVALPTRDKAKAAFDALAAGGEVRMEFTEHFWSPGFGALTDQFGTRWMIDTENPQGG